MSAPSPAYTIQPFAALGPEALERVAALHQGVMHNLLTDLGQPLLQRFYQIVRLEPSAIAFCAVAPSGQVLGWAVGSPKPQLLHATLRRPRVWFALQMLRLAVRRPAVLWQLASSAFASYSRVDAPGTIELTYIGVDGSLQNRGVGRALLGAFVAEARARGYRTIVLCAEMDNAHALALYTRFGFEVLRTIQDGRYLRHLMELKLTPA